MILALLLAASPIASLERYAERACGPEGTVSWTERKVRGWWRQIPICERYGWNGRRYAKEPRP
jgi:hypothetical protein